MPTLVDRPDPTSTTNPLVAQSFLAPSPVAPDQDASAYDTLLSLLTAEVRPSDVPEQIWLREVADHIWEIGRVRRAKVSSCRVRLAARSAARVIWPRSLRADTRRSGQSGPDGVASSSETKDA